MGFKNTRYIFFLISAGCFLSCTKPKVLPLGSFRNVAIHGNVKAEIIAGSVNAVTQTSGISVTTAVVGNSLLVSGEGNIKISVNVVDTVSANGNSTVTSSGTFNMNRLVVSCNGSNSMTLNNLNIKDSIIVLSNGSGNYTLTGITNGLRVMANGSGKLSGFGLTSTSGFVSLNGSGTSEVYVKLSLGGIINGNGMVYYKGTSFPVFPIYLSGTGKFVKI